ncbi:TetR/AcrR family transcriptional regulator [Saccharobesus litoralis]|uniref:TetR/AcrR family transcriptional regulator n=1 Tax=Saccharobesus litoralis TaxID=2172099 RepID=UPI00131F3F1D|nr:TetR/AcrR family transcriptional regulator [Saccharobesus litoralis]
MARNKEYERKTVIKQSFNVFISKGYESTSLTDLTTATGLNKKSLYNEFGNKQALFLVVLDDFIQQEFNNTRPLLMAEPLSIANIQAFFSYLFEHFANSGCLMTLSLNEASCIPQEALMLINKSLSALEQAFSRNIMADLNLDQHEANLLARNLLALMQGYTSLSRSEPFRARNFEAINQFLKSLKKWPVGLV